MNQRPWFISTMCSRLSHFPRAGHTLLPPLPSSLSELTERPTQQPKGAVSRSAHGTEPVRVRVRVVGTVCPIQTH